MNSDWPTSIFRLTIQDSEDAITMGNWPYICNDILFVDFNSHSLLWNDSRENSISDRRARKIETGMASKNTGEVTHVNRIRGKLTKPDVTFTHFLMMDKLSWRTLNMLESDHNLFSFHMTMKLFVSIINPSLNGNSCQLTGRIICRMLKTQFSKSITYRG